MKARMGESATRKQYDFFIGAKREILKSKAKIRSGYAGLFWFGDDYSDIENMKGIQEFTNGDILFHKEVGPEGSHSDRGRRYGAVADQILTE